MAAQPRAAGIDSSNAGPYQVSARIGIVCSEVMGCQSGGSTYKSLRAMTVTNPKITSRVVSPNTVVHSQI